MWCWKNFKIRTWNSKRRFRRFNYKYGIRPSPMSPNIIGYSYRGPFGLHIGPKITSFGQLWGCVHMFLWMQFAELWGDPSLGLHKLPLRHTFMIFVGKWTYRACSWLHMGPMMAWFDPLWTLIFKKHHRFCTFQKPTNLTQLAKHHQVPWKLVILIGPWHRSKQGFVCISMVHWIHENSHISQTSQNLQISQNLHICLKFSENPRENVNCWLFHTQTPFKLVQWPPNSKHSSSK